MHGIYMVYTGTIPCISCLTVNHAFWVRSSGCPETPCCVPVFPIHLTLIASWKLAKLKDLWTWYMYGCYYGPMAYTMNILGICHVFTRYFGYEVLRENYAFLNISCFNIRLSSTMALVYSIELHINPWKWKFNIQCIYLVNTRYISHLGIYMVYTWYIPTLYLVGVPDGIYWDLLFKLAKFTVYLRIYGYIQRPWRRY